MRRKGAETWNLKSSFSRPPVSPTIRSKRSCCRTPRNRFITQARAESPLRPGAPRQEPVVLEPELAVGQRFAVEPEDMAAGGFEHRLAGRGVPFHRRAKARVEICLARREH